MQRRAFPSAKNLSRKQTRRLLNGIEQLEARRLLTAELVSVTVGPEPLRAGSEYSSNPVISGNGRFVAFQSHADDLTSTADTNGTQDVFVRDLLTGVTTLISANFEGTDSGTCEGSSCAAATVSGSFDPAMSDDGRFIAFVSYATNLTEKPIESGPSPNVFLHDRDADENGIFDEAGGVSSRLLSVASDGSAAGVVPGNPTRPVISGNGRSVAFVSAATDIALDDAVPLSGLNVFLATLDGGLKLVSINPEETGSGSGGTVIDLSIDDTGRVVAFASSKPDLSAVEGGGVSDTNGALTDIFVGGEVPVEAVSVNSDFSGTGDLGSREAAISGNGRHVAFFSSATNLAKGFVDENLVEDLFVRDLKSGVTTLVSRSRAVAGAMTSGDGATPPSTLLDGDITAGPQLSNNGRFIVFRSSAGDLLDPADGVADDNEVSDIFRYDRDPDMDGVFDEPGETRMELVTINVAGTASTGFGGLPPTSAGSTAPSISSDGRYVSFVSTGVDLVPGIVGSQVYVRDMLSGITTLISESIDGFSSSIGATSPATWISVISGDGSRVAFQSARDASGLDPTVSDPPNGLPVPFAELDVFAGTPPTDIRLTRNFASGSDTHFQAFDVAFEDSAPFEIGYYLSADSLFDSSDVLLASIPVTDSSDLDVGSSVVLSSAIGPGFGEIELPGAGLDEPTEDYFILVVGDPAETIIEFDLDPFNEDNTRPLLGVYHLSGGSVLAHGGTRAEEIVAAVIGETLELNFGFVDGGSRTFTYDLADVTEVRVRTHDGDDIVVGSDLTEVAFGGAGNDRLLGAGGDDELFGGPGRDFLDGGPGADVLNGGPGPDTIMGGPGDDVLFDGPGDDLLDVGLGDDTVIATPGSDDIFITPGGNDTLDFSFAAHAIEIDLDLDSVRQVVDDDRNTIELIGQWENLVGSPFGDTFYIDPLELARIIRGGDGNDTLIIDVGGNAFVDDGTKISFPGTLLGDIIYQSVEVVRLIHFAPTFIDDEDPGYRSGFTQVDNPEFPQGFNGDIEFSAPDAGNTAAWTFDNIQPGRYLVSATWTSAPDRSSQAPFTIFDGDSSGTILNQIAVNQEIAPNEFDDQGVPWNSLGVVDIANNQLTVQLTDIGAANGGDDAHEFVIADAIRIEPLRSDVEIIDDRDAGFDSSGLFQNGLGAFGGVHVADPSVGSRSGGIWQATDLAAGQYLISATWPSGIPTAAKNVDFDVSSGVDSFTANANQILPPNDFTEGGIGWKHLGLVNVDETGVVNIEVEGFGGLVLADAIRIAPAPTFTLFDVSNSPLDPASPIDLGQVSIDSETGHATTSLGLRIQNTGPVNFGMVELFDASPPFAATTPIFELSTDGLVPRASSPFEVTFSSDEFGSQLGTLGIAIVSPELFRVEHIFDLSATVVADVTPPTVDIVAPSPGAEFIEGSKTRVTVDVADDLGLRTVELLVDGTSMETRFEAPFDFELPLPILGGPGTETVSIIARATDLAGNISDSLEIELNILDDLPPTVEILSPSDGTSVVEGSQIPVHIIATDDVSIRRVQLFVNNELQETLLTEPFLGVITVPSTTGPFDFRVVAEDFLGQTETRQLNLISTDSIATLVNADSIITGASAGQPPRVSIFGPTGELRYDFFAYSPSFLGGVRVAVGDVNHDGVGDIVTGAGPGGGPQVKVFDGQDGTLLGSFSAFDSTFTGGVSVAVGDVTGDGSTDIIVNTSTQVRVFTGVGELGGLVHEFTPFPGFGGGISVAAGDVNADGQTDIITSSGPGGPPIVKVFDGHTKQELGSFFAYDAGFPGGVRVATGDVNGDGFDDIITGAGPGGGPRVKVFDGASEFDHVA
ncbi:MAG: Ig-like domain-containing protein [Pirellulaceae bacterium]